MKRFCLIFLSIMLVFSLMPIISFADSETIKSADILYAAVDGVPVTNGKIFTGSGGNIQLTGDSFIRNRELTVNDGNTWTLDLNGYNLVLGNNLTVSNKSELIITDTSTEGNGKITFESGGIIVNGSSGGEIIGSFKDGNISYEDEQHVYSKVLLKGGTISSADTSTIKVAGNGASLTVDGGNIYNSGAPAIYTNNRKEDGGVEINILSGSVISAAAPALKLLAYGDYSVGGNNTVITGTSGIQIVSGNLNIYDNPSIVGNGESSAIRNDANGSALALVIGNALYNYGNLNVQIDGGKFSSTNAYAFDEYVSDSSGTNLADVKNVSITGGNFYGGEGSVRADILKNFISGGNFSSSPAKWIKGGYTLASANEADYKYTVLKSEANINGVVAEVVASVYPVASSDKAVQSIADTIRSNIGEMLGFDTLKALSWSMFNDNSIFSDDLLKLARSELSSLNGTSGGVYTASNPLFVIYPYFDINVISADQSTGKIELKIEAKYDLYATTAEDEYSMVKTGESKNAVKLKSYEIMKFNDPVELNIPLPVEFYQILNENFYVKHEPVGIEKSFVYYGNKRNGAVEFDVYMSNDGLGTFTINSEGPAAQISGSQTLYTTIQECVDNLNDGDTINLFTSGDAIFNKVMTFRVNDNGNKFSFKGGSGYEVDAGEDGLYRVNEIKTYFTDIKKEEYYYNAVVWAVDNKIALGISDTLFIPDGDCTRAQVVTFLWRAAGSPVLENMTNPFNDINADDYYYDAVLWAVNKGITTGMNETSFAPSDIVTRSQFVTFLSRYAGNIDLEDKSDILNDIPFTDIDAGAFYEESVNWAFQRGITTGTSEDKFNPLGTCTRGQTVTFIYRYFYQN